MRTRYTENEIAAARQDALDWLYGRIDAYPRSHDQLASDEERRGYDIYDIYDDVDECPAIYGYEQLEREGIVERVGVVNVQGQERIHFRLLAPTAPHGKDER